MKNHYIFFILLSFSTTLKGQIISETILGDEELQEQALKMIPADEGGFYLMGVKNIDESDYSNQLTLQKIDKNKEVIWETSLTLFNVFPFDCPFNHSQYPQDIVQLANGNLLVSLKLYDNICGGFAALILQEFDNTGDLINQTIADSTYYPYASGLKASEIIQVSDGGILISNYKTHSYSNGMEFYFEYDHFVIKLDDEYIEEWRKNSFQIGTDFTPIVIESPNNIFNLIFRSTLSVVDSQSISSNFLTPNTHQYTSSLAIDDGYILYGSDKKFNRRWPPFHYHCYKKNSASLVKYDNNIEVVWEKIYLDKPYFNINKAQAVKNGFLIAGSYKTQDSCYILSRQPFLAKTDTLGNIEWEHYFENGILSDFEDFIFFPDGRLILSGVIEQNSKDIYLVEFQTEERLPDFDLEEVKAQSVIFPNPARNFLTLNFSTGLIPSGSFNYSIIDVLGRVLHQEEVPFEYFIVEKEIDLSVLAHGLYYIKITYGEHVEVLSFLKQ